MFINVIGRFVGLTEGQSAIYEQQLLAACIRFEQQLKLDKIPEVKLTSWSSTYAISVEIVFAVEKPLEQNLYEKIESEQRLVQELADATECLETWKLDFKKHLAVNSLPHHREEIPFVSRGRDPNYDFVKENARIKPNLGIAIEVINPDDRNDLTVEFGIDMGFDDDSLPYDINVATSTAEPEVSVFLFPHDLFTKAAILKMLERMLASRHAYYRDKLATVHVVYRTAAFHGSTELVWTPETGFISPNP